MERWNTRTLQVCINSMHFKRAAISKKPKQAIEHDLKLPVLSTQDYKKSYKNDNE